MKPTIITIFIILIAIQSNGQEMNFAYHEIGKFGYRMGQTSLVDVDHDNDLDWVFGQSGEMYWYEYHSPTDWELHEIGKGIHGGVGPFGYGDVDNDGDIDICTKPWHGELHIYLENKLIE